MKILIIHATAGNGHKKAAEAVYNGIKDHTNYDVRCVDALDYTNSFYRTLYRKSYKILISYFSWVWAFFFWLTDIPFLLAIIRGSRKMLYIQNAGKLHRFLREENPDCIIATHFFPHEVACYLKRKNLISSKLICVVTDYDVHSMWFSKGIDHYTVASEYTKDKLISLRIPEGQISVTGIPTDEKFSKIYDRDQLKEKLGLKKDIFTTLIATGSFGIGNIEEIIDNLKGVQSIVICGSNESLFKRLSAKKMDLVKVCGFVDNMHEYMAVSDAMITKPGGLSISEALVRGLPLVFFSAIPGQETNNIRVLKGYGIGVSDVSAQEMAQEIQKLSSSEEYRLANQEKIKKIARPSAVSDIIKLIP
ncbi:MAG: glycosyltransferase [Candidatus Aceula meridiana]|nr:glycosyltransferase [Candidatus Aceula meridiana]